MSVHVCQEVQTHNIQEATLGSVAGQPRAFPSTDVGSTGAVRLWSIHDHRGDAVDAAVFSPVLNRILIFHFSHLNYNWKLLGLVITDVAPPISRGSRPLGRTNCDICDWSAWRVWWTGLPHYLLGISSRFTNTFSGLFTRWMQQMDPKELGCVQSDMTGLRTHCFNQ